MFLSSVTGVFLSQFHRMFITFWKFFPVFSLTVSVVIDGNIKVRKHEVWSCWSLVTVALLVVIDVDFLHVLTCLWKVFSGDSSSQVFALLAVESSLADFLEFLLEVGTSGMHSPSQSLQPISPFWSFQSHHCTVLL